jgi:hypothetical protein
VPPGTVRHNHALDIMHGHGRGQAAVHGCAGRVANGINTVHLSYVREKTGHALAGARQRIPAEDIKDPVKSLVTGLPLDLRFRTKGQLAADVLADAYAPGHSLITGGGRRLGGACPSLAYVSPGMPMGTTNDCPVPIGTDG